MRKLRSVGKKSNKKNIRISSKEAAEGYFREGDGSLIDPQELLLRELLPTALRATILVWAEHSHASKTP
jgi:hypothetical protein